MNQRYGYNEERGRDWDRDDEQNFAKRQSNEQGGWSRQYNQGAHSYGGTAPSGYGSQGGYGSQQNSSAQNYGSQQRNSQSQAYSPYSGQQGGYGHGNYGQDSYAQGNFGSQSAQAENYRSGYFAQGQSPNPGSHSYSGQYAAPYGAPQSGSQHFPYVSQAYNRGSQGYPSGGFGSNAPSDEQLRQGSRLAFSDQPGYGQTLHGGFNQNDEQSPQNWSGRGQRRAPKSYQRSDERLKEDIYERLSNQWDVDATEVIVEVVSGKVVLRGSVPDRRTRHAIENIVDQAHGVQDIENNLRVESLSQNSNLGNNAEQSGSRYGSSALSQGSGIASGSAGKNKES